MIIINWKILQYVVYLQTNKFHDENVAFLNN